MHHILLSCIFRNQYHHILVDSGVCIDHVKPISPPCHLISPNITPYHLISPHITPFSPQPVHQELGLIFKAPRSATVESASPMELLVVGKVDFLKIFMHNVMPGEDPGHVAFLK